MGYALGAGADLRYNQQNQDVIYPMGIFSNSSIVRVLLLTSRNLSAFTWQNGVLLPVAQFAADEEGLGAFDHYLNSPPDCPLYLVTDVIEEDFRQENAAHVLGRDRRALLERKLAQFFRTTEYRAARVQGRETGGRRDDQVLFCALTNNEQIAFWVNRILAQKAPLQGVLSVPWLLESFADSRKLAHIPHLLLVNIGHHGGLRQTYLQAGHVKFSRLTSLATIHLNALAETILGECTHTRQYLERLKLLARDQPLEVDLTVQGEIGEEIGAKLESTSLMRFQLHETGVVAAELGIDPAREDGQGVVFLALMQALRTKGLFNVYGSNLVLRYYRLRQLRKGIILGTSLFFAVVLATSFPLLRDGFKQRQVENRLKQEAKQLSQQYSSVQQNFPEAPIPAQAMQKVVDSVDAIQRQTVYPGGMMGLVSRALVLCPDIRVRNLDWKLTGVAGSTEENGAEGMGDGQLPVVEQPEGEGGEQQGKTAVPALLLGMLAGKAQVITTLEGSVFPNGGFLAAHQSITRFITTLELNQGLTVTPMAMPTEISPDGSIKATLNGEAFKADFSLQLTSEVRQ
jgi:hypothetical protein